MRNLLRCAILVLAVLGAVFAQGHAAPQKQASPATAGTQNARPANQSGEPAPPPAQEPSVGGELAHASNEAAGEPEGNEKFTQSASVRAIARMTGLSVEAARWISFAVNFLIMAGILFLLWKAKVPALFRTRTGEIQRGITEARKASEDANRRLAEIEKRLAKLDDEVGQMRSKAEEEAAAEEARIRQAAEEDGRKIVNAANAEISAAAKLARRELKIYTADLAIALAEKRIQVDPATDRALVGNFIERLNEPGSAGKDGQ